MAAAAAAGNAAAARHAMKEKEKNKPGRSSPNGEQAGEHLDVEMDSLGALRKPTKDSGGGSILGPHKKLWLQDEVKAFYQHKFVVTFVALCIMGNFAVNIIEKEIDPDPNNLKYPKFWASADVTFNIIFIFELWANIWSYGGPVREFWKSGWNVFDSVIVLVGFLTMVNALGPPLDKLKLMRAFRVFRLFKRVKALNKIIVALINSIPAVFYAFVVMFIFICIFAILAVELFRDFGSEGVYYTTDPFTGNVTTIDAITGRGYLHGYEYYGNFMRALYTLFQVMTGESWAEAIARPLLFGLYQNNSLTVGLYFSIYIILMQMVMINVVVAVLLENFVTDEPEEPEEEGSDTDDPTLHDGDDDNIGLTKEVAKLREEVKCLSSSMSAQVHAMAMQTQMIQTLLAAHPEAEARLKKHGGDELPGGVAHPMALGEITPRENAP